MTGSVVRRRARRTLLRGAFRDALKDPGHLAVLERFDMPMMYAEGAEHAHHAQEPHAEDSAMVRAMGLRY